MSIINYLKKKKERIQKEIIGIFILTTVVFGLARFSEWKSAYCFGIRICSDEELADLCCDKMKLDQIENGEGLLYADSVPVPFAQDSGAFFLVWKENIPVITTANGIQAYLKYDEYFENVEKAKTDGYRFPLVLLSDNSYCECSMILTDIPVVSIRLDEYISTDYSAGKLSVMDAEQSVALSCKAKRNSSNEVITFKLKDDETILGLKESSTWQLQKIDKKDKTFLRQMLSTYVWNSVCEIPSLKIQMKYVELILNGNYKGLYLLTQKEDRASYNEKDNVFDVFFRGRKAKNACEYYAFLQLTCAYTNIDDNYYIVPEVNNDYLKPGRIEYSFGTLPDRLAYLLYRDSTRLIMPEDIGCVEAQMKTFNDYMKNHWKEWRNSSFSPDNLLQQIENNFKYLENSGFFARSGVALSEIKNDGDVLKAYCDYRFSRLDEWYN